MEVTGKITKWKFLEGDKESPIRKGWLVPTSKEKLKSKNMEARLTSFIAVYGNLVLASTVKNNNLASVFICMAIVSLANYIYLKTKK